MVFLSPLYLGFPEQPMPRVSGMLAQLGSSSSPGRPAVDLYEEEWCLDS